MTNNHLTDEMLQAFLLEETQDDTATTHLKTCFACKQKLEEYQFLMTSLQKIKPESFSLDITSLVMQNINKAETRKEKNISMILYIILSVVITLTFLLLYPHLKVIFIQFKSSTIMENAFLLSSALGVAVFLLNDLFRKYKQKETLLWQ